MISDLKALLSAVVADPSDDVARLVYADCLEENGNAARAAFIRLQIEAERHHPHSNARAALEAQARVLFERHWIEWWSEVCAAVGLEAPTPEPHGRMGRLAVRAGFRPNAGDPYFVTGFTVERTGSDGARHKWPLATFCRGFPDSVRPGLIASAVLPAWFEVSPLSSMTLRWDTDARFECADLRTVRELTLVGYDFGLVSVAIDPTTFERLESLHFEPSVILVSRAVLALCMVLRSPRARQLKRLSFHVWSEDAAQEIAAVDELSGLESLSVSVGDLDPAADPAEAGRWLATLAASPHLANLKELSVTGGIDANGLGAVLRGRWTGLRRLTLDLQPEHDALAALAGPDNLQPALEELRLLNLDLNSAIVTDLARSAILKRVRHFALGGSPADRTTLPRLVGAVNLYRIETFALILPPHEPLREYAVELLRRWFGDRGRVIAG